MPTFPDLLARLDALLQARRPAYYATLNPPAAAAELAAFEAEFGLQLPPELRQWYGWHNGQSDFDSFVQNYELHSLSDAAETMRISCGMLEAGEFVPNWWRPGWVPFLHNGGGDHVCLDTEGTFTGQPGQILEHWHDWEMRSVAYPDFTAWLAAVVRAYEQASTTPGPLTEEAVLDFEPEHPEGFPQDFAVE